VFRIRDCAGPHDGLLEITSTERQKGKRRCTRESRKFTRIESRERAGWRGARHRSLSPTLCLGRMRGRTQSSATMDENVAIASFQIAASATRARLQRPSANSGSIREANPPSRWSLDFSGRHFIFVTVFIAVVGDAACLEPHSGEVVTPHHSARNYSGSSRLPTSTGLQVYLIGRPPVEKLSGSEIDASTRAFSRL